MTRSTWWCCGLGISLFWGCLLPDVGIDDSLGEEEEGSAGTPAVGSGSLQGAGGAAGTAQLMPPNNSSGAGGSAGAVPAPVASAGSSANGGGAGAGSSGAGGAAPSDPCVTTSDREFACQQYCTAYTSACSDFLAAYDYSGTVDCIRVCLDSVWPIGDPARVEPGSVMCRCYHAGLAATNGVTPHCYHAARVPSMGSCEVPAP